MEPPKKRASNINPKSFLNGKIYKIQNTENDMIYIGSTTQSLPKRFYSHRIASLLPDRNSPFYSAIKTIGFEHFKILLIELFSCTCKAELEAREYAIMNLEDKTKLYNSTFNGKLSDETKMKQSIGNKRIQLGKFGAESLAFKRGCINERSTNSTKPTFTFRWEQHGETYSKSFGFKHIRTRQMAYMMCLDKQNEVYPLTHGDYMKELPFSKD